MLLVLWLVFIVLQFSMSITGHTLQDLRLTRYARGELFKGSVSYDIVTHPLPTNAQVTLNLNGYIRTLPVSQIIQDVSASTLIRPVLQAPELRVSLEHTAPEPEPSGGGNGCPYESSDYYGACMGACENTEDIEFCMNACEASGGVGYIPSDCYDDFGITGNIVSSSRNYGSIGVTVKKGSPAEIPSEQGSSLSVSRVSLASNEETLVSTSEVTVQFDSARSVYVVSTEYQTSSSMYVGQESRSRLNLDLSAFQMTVPQAQLLTVRVLVTAGSSTESWNQLTQTFLTNTNLPTSPGYVNDPSSFGRKGKSFDGGSLWSPYYSDSMSGQPGTSGTSIPPGCTPICQAYSACQHPIFLRAINSMQQLPSVQQRLCYCQEDTSITFVEARTCFYDLNGIVASAFTSPKAAPTDPSLSPTRPVVPVYVDGTFNSMSAVALNPRISAEWRYTITETGRDIATHGALKSELPEDTRITLSYEGAKHSVGVRTLEKDSEGRTYVDVEVASVPQSARLYEGQQAPFDLDGDSVLDVGVTFTGVKDNKASLLVERLTGNNLISLSPGEKGVQLSDKITNDPLAYLILRERLPSRLTVILVQSEMHLPASCSNLIQDRDEEGIDCGPSCRICHAEEPFYNRSIWLSVAGTLVLACAFVFGRRLLFVNN